jgi:zinc transporter ZupT
MVYSVYLYALLATLSELAGGALPFHPRLRQLDARYVLGFAAGILVSLAFFELIPESNPGEHHLFLVLGFFSFYLIEKVAMLHSCGERECEIHSIGWVSVAGMAGDNVIDGIAIAIGYLTQPALGLLITLAVIVHEIPQGITSTVIMKASGFPLHRIILVLTVAGLMYPVGAFLSAFIPAHLHQIVIAFVAGEFIYIGASDLLWEAHRRFNVKVVAAVILGGLFPMALESFL